jgi:hypothetical protein
MKTSELKREIEEIWPLRDLKPFIIDDSSNLGGFWLEASG